MSAKRYITEEVKTCWIPGESGKPEPFSHMIYDTSSGKRPLAIARSQVIALQMVRIFNEKVTRKKKKEKG